MKLLLRKILAWAFAGELAAYRAETLAAAVVEARRTAAAVADAGVGTLTRQLQAIQAIDVSFRETGKLIIVCRVGGKDYVKIIDLRPDLPRDEWMRLVRHVESAYGAARTHADVPFGLPRDYFG